jgi:hypothetical protein
MAEAGPDRHQLAGLDNRERGFSRPVELERAEEGYRAVLRYESLVVATDHRSTQDEALHLLVRLLHEQGYRELRTQRSFCGGLYLGSQEQWFEYPDPPPVGQKSSGWIAKLAELFRP